LFSPGAVLQLHAHDSDDRDDGDINDADNDDDSEKNRGVLFRDFFRKKF
jgi:hypothetical protein